MADLLAECTDLLDQWPSSAPFSVEDILQRRPDFAGDRHACEMLIAEAFIRRLEQGEPVCPSSFLRQFPDASSSLSRRLRKLADLHDQAGLLQSDGQEAPSFPGTGETIGGYQLLEQIGSGAYSRVFLAADTNAGHRRVVVKVTSRGQTEAEFLGPLRHPNLPKILSCRTDPEHDLTVLCMEFVGTRTLADEIAALHKLPAHARRHRAERGEQSTPTQRGPAPNKQPEASQRETADFRARTVEVIRQVASGLAHAHEHGMLHLDIKPGNVVLGEDGRAVLIDFNLSAPTAISHELPFRGTLAYAAPEVLESAAADDLGVMPVSAACDVYSLGAVMYELLTGELPWGQPAGDSLSEAARQALSDRQHRVDPPSSRNRSVDARLDTIVMRALAPMPGERFASAREFAAALAACPPSPAGGRRWVSRTVLAASIASVVLGILFADVPATITDASRPQPAAGPTREVVMSRIDGPRLDRPQPGVGAPAETAPPAASSLLQRSDDELRDLLQELKSGEIPGDSTERATSIGYINLLLEEYRGATRGLRQALSQEPDNEADHWCNLGYCYIQQQKFSAAARALDRALLVSPDNERVLFLRSIAELETAIQRNRRPSMKFFNQLLAMQSQTSSELVRTAVVCERRIVSENERSSDDRHSGGPYERAVRQFSPEGLPEGAADLRTHSTEFLLPHPREEEALQLGLPIAMSTLINE